MPASLYEVLAEPVLQSPGPGPTTTITHAVETIDNDRAALDQAMLATGDQPSPGTRITESTETVDEDRTLLDGALLGGQGPRPEPGPGTALTATVETTDENSLLTMPLHVDG